MEIFKMVKKYFFGAFFALSAAMFLAACATSDPQSDEVLAQVAITHATQSVIEKAKNPAERAAKLHDIAVEARSLLKGENVALPNLEKAVRDRLVNERLTPTDYALIDSLVRTIAYELSRRVGADTLDSEQRVAVERVIDLVIATSSLYLPTQSPS
jgi:hypothetical protein